MNIAFYTGVSGMITHQQELDTVSHNIANVNTTGYKDLRTSFSDLLYTEMNVNQQTKPLTGHGVRAASTDMIFSQGAPGATNSPLDFALIGEGLFAIDRGGEQPEYTRNGAFNIGMDGKKGYLTTSDGGYVLDAKGKHIALTMKEDQSGFDLKGVKDLLGIYSFPNPYGLQPTSGGSFKETPLSGAAKAIKITNQADMPYQLAENALENSTVNLADEMVRMIMTQKAFQFSAKVVQTADQIEEIVNTLR